MNGLQTVSIREAREQFSELVNQAAIANKRFVITKFGKPKAVIFPFSKQENLILQKARLKALEETFGMWADRTDIKDSAEWVAEKRKNWANRNG